MSYAGMGLGSVALGQIPQPAGWYIIWNRIGGEWIFEGWLWTSASTAALLNKMGHQPVAGDYSIGRKAWQTGEWKWWSFENHGQFVDWIYTDQSGAQSISSMQNTGKLCGKQGFACLFVTTAGGQLA